MKSYFIFFIFLLICLSQASATLEINKGRLDFNAVENQETCQTITISSQDYNGIISVRDVWAEYPNETRNLRSYNFTAEEHEMIIDYPKNLDSLDTSAEIQVCLTANKVGDYKGKLIFTPEAEGDGNLVTVIELAVKLFVNVTEPANQPETPPITNNPGGNSGGGSPTPKTTPEENQTEQEIIKLSAENPEDSQEAENQNLQNSPLTGSTINNLSNAKNKIIPVLIILIIITIASIFIYNKRRNK